MSNSLRDKERETEQEKGRQPHPEDEHKESELIKCFRRVCDEVYSHRHNKQHQAQVIRQITAEVSSIMGPTFVPEAVISANRWAAGEPRTFANWTPSL